MNRIITILVTIFILLLLYIWISHVWGSESPRHPKPIVDATETGVSDDLTAETDTTAAIPPVTNATEEPVTTEDFSTERKVETKTEPVSQPEVKTPPVTEKKTEQIKTEEKKKIETKPVTKPAETKPATTSTTSTSTSATTKNTTAPTKNTNSPQTVTSSTDGRHLVIAGNFSQLANAQQRVSELKKAGFQEAEVVQFDLSEYHTVCVGRFADVNEARRLVKKLKDYHKIDAYVRIGS